MKVLHVGWGFLPFRYGGLIEYAEDLMEKQSQNGYEVSYFCTGRTSVFITEPTVKKWRSKKGYHVYELWNPPIIGGLETGIDQPLLDFSEATTEKLFLDVVRKVEPAVVHFQEFYGIPTSVIAILKSQGIKTVFTIQDYFTLCPTLKLVKSNNEICRIQGNELGANCAICCASAPKNNFSFKVKSTFRNVLSEKNTQKIKKFAKSISIGNRGGSGNNPASNLAINASQDDQKNAGYNERRLKNLEYLQGLDLMIAMSNRVATIFNYYQKFENMTVLSLTLDHINKIAPYQLDLRSKEKIAFSIINVMGSNILKGTKLVLDLFAMLDKTEIKDKVEFFILGNIKDEYGELLKQYSFVKCIGLYNPDNLTSILENLKIDVGIVPSLWEEAYGYVGVEFLAKGIPVIGNNIGGIPDYVIDGETGWLNNSLTSGEMLQIIHSIVSNPASVIKLNSNLLEKRGKYIKGMNEHFGEMDNIYKELIAG